MISKACTLCCQVVSFSLAMRGIIKTLWWAAVYPLYIHVFITCYIIKVCLSQPKITQWSNQWRRSTVNLLFSAINVTWRSCKYVCLRQKYKFKMLFESLSRTNFCQKSIRNKYTLVKRDQTHFKMSLCRVHNLSGSKTVARLLYQPD